MVKTSAGAQSRSIGDCCKVMTGTKSLESGTVSNLVKKDMQLLNSGLVMLQIMVLERITKEC